MLTNWSSYSIQLVFRVQLAMLNSGHGRGVGSGLTKVPIKITLVIESTQLQTFYADQNSQLSSDSLQVVDNLYSLLSVLLTLEY